ncbi:MAG: hypothetical protein ACRCWC_07645 [Plesiomonas shigelloides]
MKHWIYRLLGSLLVLVVLALIVMIGADNTPRRPQDPGQPAPVSSDEKEMKGLKIN